MAALQAVAFGMGGGLLQRVNRDTMSFATKLSHIVYADGTETDTMKLPKSDPLKYSLPGIMAVKSVDGVPTAFPADGGHVSPEENMLQVVWDSGPVEVSSSLCWLQRAVSYHCDACRSAQCMHGKQMVCHKVDSRYSCCIHASRS